LVVCDIIPEGLSLCDNKFEVQEAKALITKNNKEDFATLSALPDKMKTLFSKTLNSVNSLSDTHHLKLIKPMDLISSYCNNNQIKTLIDSIVLR
jgi:hypothetical protein